eukprot:scaffold236951_cov30-Tisochrysis_lutea.AAC.1
MGQPLACPHDLEDSPYPRARGVRHHTVHYTPEAAGDSIHAEIYKELGAANRREMCTLLPSLSYLHDALLCADECAKELRGRRRSPGSRHRASQLATTVADRRAAGLAHKGHL